jgi:hypothetical protein
MKTEWWYESALFDLDNTLVFARLTVQDEGSANVLTDAGERLEFASEDDARTWLGDEEYYPLDHLVESLKEQGIPVDPRIKPPVGERDDEVLKQMVVALHETPNAAPMPPLSMDAVANAQVP